MLHDRNVASFQFKMKTNEREKKKQKQKQEDRCAPLWNCGNMSEPFWCQLIKWWDESQQNITNKNKWTECKTFISKGALLALDFVYVRARCCPYFTLTVRMAQSQRTFFSGVYFFFLCVSLAGFNYRSQQTDFYIEKSMFFFRCVENNKRNTFRVYCQRKRKTLWMPEIDVRCTFA